MFVSATPPLCVTGGERTHLTRLHWHALSFTGKFSNGYLIYTYEYAIQMLKVNGWFLLIKLFNALQSNIYGRLFHSIIFHSSPLLRYAVNEITFVTSEKKL